MNLKRYCKVLLALQNENQTNKQNPMGFSRKLAGMQVLQDFPFSIPAGFFVRVSGILLQMYQVQVMKAGDLFCNSFVNLHFRLNSTVQYSFGSVLLPDLLQLNESCSPGLVSFGTLMRFIITAVCAEQSLTPEPHLALLVCYCSQVSNYWTAGSLLTHTHTHTFLIHFLLILTHTTSITGGVSERECSICLSAS